MLIILSCALALTAAPRIHAMEEKSSITENGPTSLGIRFQNNPKTIFLKTTDGVVKLKPTLAKKLKTIKHLMNDFSSDFKPEVDLQSFHNPPSKKSIELLANLIENHKTTSLNAMQQKQVFNAANILEAPKHIRRELAEKLIDQMLHQRHRKKLNLTKIEPILVNLPRSIKTALIMQKLGYKPAVWLPRCMNSKDKLSVYLNNNDLQSLDGIEELASEKTIILDISNNNLKKLDLEKIKTIFPNINRIYAENNCIKKLYKQDLKALSTNLRLVLDDNHITRCEQTSFLKTPENIRISLKKNPLTSNTLHALSSSLEQSNYQRLSHNFYKQLMPITSAINTFMKDPAFEFCIIFICICIHIEFMIYEAYHHNSKYPLLIQAGLILLSSITFETKRFNHFVTLQARKKFHPNTIVVDPGVTQQPYPF